MSVKTVTCVTVTCDGCDEDAPVFEDMGIAHYESVEQARKQLVDDVDGEPEYQWSVNGDEWLCATCTAAKVCEDAGGHDWGGWDVYGANAYRACRRGACQRSERRPVEDVSS